MSRILIAGAGIGGLTAALALLCDGHQVRLFEQATDCGKSAPAFNFPPTGRAC
jgi:salicylate hydroxylase